MAETSLLGGLHKSSHSLIDGKLKHLNVFATTFISDAIGRITQKGKHFKGKAETVVGPKLGALKPVINSLVVPTQTLVKLVNKTLNGCHKSSSVLTRYVKKSEAR